MEFTFTTKGEEFLWFALRGILPFKMSLVAKGVYIVVRRKMIYISLLTVPWHKSVSIGWVSTLILNLSRVLLI